MGLLDNIQKKATSTNARNMIIFSYPKVGKTSLMSSLPGTYLLLDFESGSDFFNMNAIKIDSVETLTTLRQEFIEKNPHFNFIVLDTITSLNNNIVNAVAVAMYNKEEKKNKSLDFDITLLNYGIGYTYKRNAIQSIMTFFQAYCDCLISLGHVADKALGGSDEAASVKDLDVEGKLKNILALKTDALGLLYRSAPDTNTLSFKVSADKIAGTRINHLTDKEIVISKRNEDGTITTYWDEVFIKPKA